MKRKNLSSIIIITAITFPLQSIALISRVNTDTMGLEANNYSYSSMGNMSHDGHFVVFNSFADNLVPGDTNGSMDVFIKDTRNGSIFTVSSDSNGIIGNTTSFTNGSNMISEDSRYVVFNSYATNLVPSATSYNNIFLKDIESNEISHISIAFNGDNPNNDSNAQAISADGTAVLFESYATNIVSGDTNGENDIFVRNITLGVTERVSISGSGEEANGASYPLSISSDGRYVLYYSYATNIVPDDTNNLIDMFIYDRQNGSVIRVNTDENGVEANNYTDPVYTKKGMTPDATFVIFNTDATLVVNDTNNQGDVYIKNTVDGGITLVSTNTNGELSNHYSYPVAIAGSGRYVLFNSNATNFWTGNINTNSHVYLKDTISGELELIDISGNGNIDSDGSSNGIDISIDGRYILFESSTNNLVPGDTNSNRDSFVKDRITGEISLVHADSYGDIGNGSQTTYQLSDDGRYVLLQSNSNNLVPDDANGNDDIFVNEWQILLMGAPSITSPIDQSYLNINTILVQGISATGAQVEVIFSGVTYTTVGNSSNGSWAVNLPQVADGDYIVQARQKYDSDITWSPYETHEFSVDTTSPQIPSIISPTLDGLIENRSTYVIGTGEPGGTIRVQVGSTTKVGLIDGLGNWNIGPFTVLEGYKYAMKAQQIDIAGNQSVFTPIQAIYGVDVGVTSINTDDFTPDMILSKNGNSNGSSTGTDKNQNITYSLTYDNIGNAYATGVVIYEKIPANTCFTLGSISGLLSGNIVEYSNNNGNTYSYTPTGASGSQDCSITDIRVVFVSQLDASTYISTDIFSGINNNTTGNNMLGVVLAPKDGITIYSTGSRTKLSLFADINNDNFLDLITISTGGLNSKYHLFNGIGFDTGISYYNGTYSGADACPNNCSIQLFAGDVNGDGRKDIVAGNMGTGVLYFRNNGNGFDTVIEYTLSGAGNYNVWGMEDLDNDGYMDIASRGGYFMGSATGFVGPFAGPQTPTVSIYQFHPTFADLNNDGLKDILFNGVYYGAYSWYTFFQGGSNGFSSGYNLNPGGKGTYYGGNYIVDFNKDGWNDIILPHYNGTIAYYRNNQAGGFDTGYNLIPGEYPTSPVSMYGAGVLDLNNDGFIDIVGVGLNHPSKLFLGTSSGLIASGIYVGQYFAEITPAFADINNDGKKDIIFNKYNGYGNPMFYWLWTGTSYANGAIWSPQQYTIGFTDINNDQYPDIIGSFAGNHIFALNNSKGGTADGITGTQFEDYYDGIYVSGSYTTILSASGDIQSWNKLYVGEDIISGSNDISYSIYGVSNNLCNTLSGALLDGVHTNNGFIDISLLPIENQSLCIVASLTINEGVVSPKIRELFVTWTPSTLPAFSFDAKVTNGSLSGNTITNTAFISSSTYEDNTGNNSSTHIFALPGQQPVTSTPSGGFGGGLGGTPGGTTQNGGTNGGDTTTIKKGDLTPQEIAEIIKEIDTKKPEKPTVETIHPTRPTEPVTSVTISPTTPNLAIKDAIVKTSYVSVGTTVEIKTSANPVLSNEKKCYTPKEVVDITLGKNTSNKDQLVYQALLRSYDLTIFNDTDAYMPENGLKRYEAAKMFVNFAKHVLCREATTVYDNSYIDIDEIDETLRPYIIQAYEYGILKGAKNQFRPLEKISRKEFVAALMRMFTNTNMDIQGMGNDWDKNYQDAFKEYGLESIVGVDEEINRYAMSKIMYKLYYNKTYEWTEKGYVLPYGRD